MEKVVETYNFIQKVISVQEQSAKMAVHGILSMTDAIHEINQKYSVVDFQQMNILKLMSENENENLHSRILKAILSYHKDGEYPFLESFLNNLFIAPFEYQIISPQFVNEYSNSQSNKRIDLLIYEKGRYSIIIENKSNDAEYQDNQLANYIDMMLSEGYHKEDIYVILLEDDHPAPPTKHIWISNTPEATNYEDEFSSRFECLSFKYNILSWLKQQKLLIQKEEDILISLVTQYIDFIEQRFELTKQYQPRMNEIQKYLSKELNLNGNPISDVTILTSKINDVKEVLSHLKDMHKESASRFIKDLMMKLQADYPGNDIKTRELENNYPTVSVHLSNRTNSSIIGIAFQIDIAKQNQYYGIEPIEKNTRDEKYRLTKPVIDQIGGFSDGVNWCYLKNCSIEDAYLSVKELIDALKAQDWE